MNMNTDQLDLLKSAVNVGRKRASEMTEQEIKDRAPSGATYIDHIGRYWDFSKMLVFIDGDWIKDKTGYCCIWIPL